MSGLKGLVSGSRVVGFLAFLALPLATPLCADPFLRGQVLDPQEEPISGALVELIPAGDAYATALARLGGQPLPPPVASAVTGSQGEYVLEAPAIGVFQVRVTMGGWMPLLSSEIALTYDWILSPAELSKAGVVTLRTQPGEVDVLLLPRPKPAPEESQAMHWGLAPQGGRSDEAGHLSLPWTHGESMTLIAARPGWRGLEKEDLSVTGGSLEIALPTAPQGEMESGGTCTFGLAYRGGQPAAGVVVLTGRAPVGITDGEGRLVLGRGRETLKLLTPQGESWSMPFSCEGMDVVSKVPRVARRQGRVVDFKGEPIEGALVWGGTTQAPPALTDAQGEFERLSMGREREVWWAEATGFNRRWFAVEPLSEGSGAGEREPLVFSLQEAPFVRGHLLTVDEQPIVGGTVEVKGAWRVRSEWFSHGSPWAQGRSWLDGWFFATWNGRSNNSVAVKGTAPELASVTRFLPSVTPELLTVQLPPGSLLFGEVVGPGDEPIEGAQVALAESRLEDHVVSGEGPHFEAFTGGEGDFVVEPLPVGKFDVLVRAEGFAELPLPGVRVQEPGEEIDLGILALEEGADIEGIVRDPGGRPIPEARIRMADGGSSRPTFGHLRSYSPSGEPAAVGGTRTDEEGRFAIRDLRAGERLSLSVSHDEYIAVSVPEVEVPTEGPLEIELQPGIRVSGRVLDESGAPIPSAQVQLNRQSTGGEPIRGPWEFRGQGRSTDEEGRFRFGNLGPGSWQIKADHPDFLTTELPPISLVEGSPRDGVEITLHPGATIFGHVLDASGSPVPQARVSQHIEEGNHSSTLHQPTDEDGRYEFRGVRPGRVILGAEAQGKGSTRLELQVQPDTNQVDLHLTSSAPGISGWVVNPDGERVDVATVLILGAAVLRQTSTVKDGTFEVSNLEPGEYRLAAEAVGLAPSEYSLVVVGSLPVTGLELRLQRGLDLSGRLTGLTLEQLARTSIQATRISGHPSHSTARPDLEARYHFDGLTPGRWRITAQIEGGVTVERWITLAEGASGRELDIHFDAEVRFQLRLLENGIPAAGVAVSLSGTLGSAQGRTDPQGVATFEGLVEGEYNLLHGAQWETNPREVEVRDGAEVTVDISTGQVTGNVLDATTGEPLANVTFKANSPSMGQGVSFRSGADGQFRQRLGSGSYSITALKDGFRAQTQEIEIIAQELNSLSFALEREGQRSIFLRTATGEVPTRVQLMVLSAQRQNLLHRSLTPDEQGRSVLPAVPPDAILLFLSKRLALREIPASGLEDGATVTLYPGSNLEVRFLAESGDRERPLSAELTLISPEGVLLVPRRLGMPMDSWTLEGGPFYLPGLQAGAWRYRVVASDGRVWQDSFQAVPGQSSVIEIH